MKLKHPLSGDVYTSREDGTVRVEAADGSVGVFAAGGAHVSGDIREADAHLIGWVLSPDMVNRRRGLTVENAQATAPGGVSVPQFEPKPHKKGRKFDMDLGLQGRKVLVTAATRGIGLSIAREFADAGCDIALCARGESGLETAAEDLKKRGAKVFSRAVDVAEGDAFKSFVNEAAEALGGLDIYVSNASGGSGPGEQAWQASFDVDVMGAVRGVEAALPALGASEAGSVVFIGSTAALEYLGVPQAYNAMKAALIAHAGDLSQALAPQGIRVNVISPGPIYFEGGSWEMIKQAMPAVYEQALGQCAIGRMGTPEEVARAVVFVASPAASLITGANLVCDGGFTKRMPF